MPSTVLLVLTAASVLVGAAAQRITGIGFALVAAPLLVASVGPISGITLSNVLSAVICASVLATAWRHTRWKRVALMVAPALVAIPLGVIVTHHVPAAPLTIGIGSLALAALAAVAFSDSARLLPGRVGAAVAGGASGFMYATAGVGGPPIAVHAYSDGWTRDMFLGTGQAFMLATALTSVATKGIPQVDPSVWLAALGALAVGMVAGGRLAPFVGERLGKRLVIALAAAGSVAAIVRGILML